MKAEKEEREKHMIYVMSDIHGEYDKFKEVLKQINLQKEDLLYVLGDVVDRGPHPMEILLKMMEMPNVIPIAGNHELIALKCLRFLNQEITDESIDDLEKEMLDDLMMWQMNGSKSTIDEYRRLTPDMRQEVMEYLTDFELYQEVSVNGKEYLLVHGGLGNYRKDKDMEEYDLHELVWSRIDYEKSYYEDFYDYIITGHTPTLTIPGMATPASVYRKNQHIAIDCGACFEGGRLAAICLDTGEEFYSQANMQK